MALSSFCGLLTLQVGVSVLAAVFFALAGVILAANVFDYHNDIEDGWFPFSLIFMIIFVIGLIIAGILMFASAYTENRSLAMTALIVIVILIIYWLILCCFSFLSNPEHVHGICIKTRCPESFWIGNVRYRGIHFPEDYREPIPPPPPPPPPPLIVKKASKKKRWMEPIHKHYKQKSIEDQFVLIKREERGNWEQPRKEGESTHPFYDQRIAKRDQKTIDGSEDQIEDGRGIVEIKKGTGFIRNQNYNNVTGNERFDYLQQRRDRDSVKEHEWIGRAEDKIEYEDYAALYRWWEFWWKRSNGTRYVEKEAPRYVFGFGLIGSIILFLINLIFLIYSALVMYSWGKELDWVDYYYEEYPVEVVDDYI